MAQKVLTWSNSQLNNRRYNFHVPCLRSSSYVPCFFVLYMYSVKIHFRCERCGICVDLCMIYNYMLRIARVREGSQIDFATGNVFLHVWGGGAYTRKFLKF